MVVPKPMGEALAQATVRLRGHNGCSLNLTVDGFMKVGMFRQVLCEKVVSPLPECFTEMDIMSGQGTLTLLSIVKPKVLIKSYN